MSTPKRNTTSIIVTYGNRAEFCLRVVGAAFDNGVDCVIIVDNGSPQDNQEKLRQAAEGNSRIILLRNDENLGSSGGVTRGLAHALAQQPDDIWLLDDDNLPTAHCLENLQFIHLALREAFKDVVLYCYRGSTHINDLRAVTNGEIKNYRKNAFLAFSFGARLMKIFNRNHTERTIFYPVVRTCFGPYGGLFASREIFERLGFPREDYFLYADDHEYSKRMVDLHIDQFLIYSAQVNDLDASFSGTEGLLDPAVSALKVYYMIRNHTHLGFQDVTCRLIYQANKFCFLFFQLVLARRRLIRTPGIVLKRLGLILLAISDGEAGRLGRRRELE